jgi:hypothetical protein
MELAGAAGTGYAQGKIVLLQQCTNDVLMIGPAAFDYNPETAATNRMQGAPVHRLAGVQALARAEFDAAVRALAGAGVRVCVVEDTPEPPKPDACFPNNWVSFHADGTVVLYPMFAPNRRLERRGDVIDAVVARTGFVVRRLLDLSPHERQGRFLEGTGSLVLDHRQRVAYACRSPRTDATLVETWCADLGYEPVVFDAADAGGVPFYHTNVMLSVGERVAIAGLDAIAAGDRARVLRHLESGGREVFALDQREIAGFAGNVLELASWDESLGDCRILAMSETARRAIGDRRFARLAGCTDDVVIIPVPTIERLGGGSIRCMLAEVFLPA